MKKLVIKLNNFLYAEEGQGMVEYGLIIGLVAIALIAGVGVLSGGADAVFKSIGNTLSGKA